MIGNPSSPSVDQCDRPKYSLVQLSHLLLFAVCLVAFFALAFVRGFYLAFLPFAHLTPVVVIGLCIMIIYTAVALVVHLLSDDEPIANRVLAFALATLVALLASQIPSTDKAFELRMAQLSEDEWLALASQARNLVAARTERGERSTNWHSEVVAELARSNPVLSLGDFPPRLIESKKEISFLWGSGLVGTLGVSIVEPGLPPPTPHELYRRWSLYPRVVLISH